MPDLTKIATCSYCGTRSVLHLSGRVQHELACSSCGARLHEMKHLRRADPEPKTRETKVAHHRAPKTQSRKTRKRRKPTPLIRRMASLFEDIFDEIEDILD